MIDKSFTKKEVEDMSQEMEHDLELIFKEIRRDAIERVSKAQDPYQALSNISSMFDTVLET